MECASSTSTSSMSHPNSNSGLYHSDDGQSRALNSNQMMHTFMDPYMSQNPSSTLPAYTPPLHHQYADPQDTQMFQVPSSLGHSHAPASRGSWDSVTPTPGHGPFNGIGQSTLPMSGGLPLHGGEQPTFADLMREMSHEQSRALHEAARRAPFIPVTPTVPVQQQGLTFSSEFFAQTSSLTPSSHSTSRSSSGSISGGSAGGYQHTGNIAPEHDDALFEMFPCDMCTASFSRRHDLERHKRGHSGEAPYTCGGCGGGFTRSDGRGRHWKLQPACEALHFERGGSGKRRSGLPPSGPLPRSYQSSGP